MDPAVGDLPRGDVLVEGDRIAAVGVDLDVPGPVEVVDASGCILVPGFVDTHRHMWEGALRGTGAHDTLDSYFHRVLENIGPALSPEDLAVGEALSARASLRAGITTVQDTSDINDAPARTDALVGALRESGIRAVFAYGMSWPQVHTRGGTYDPDVHRVRTELLADDDALVTMALSTRDVDDASERHNTAVARELDVRTARHVRARIRPSRQRDLGTLLPGTVFVHGNGLSHDELSLMRDAGGALSVSPAVELVMGLGTPMVNEALAVPGLPITLSIDVEVTSPTDMFTQMRLLYTTHRATERPTDLGMADILRAATINGARALGLGDRTGSITPGKQADLVLLRADGVDTAPVADPYSAVVLQMDRSHIDTVLVAGTVHRRGGAPVRDDAALVERGRDVVRRLDGAGLLAGTGV